MSVKQSGKVWEVELDPMDKLVLLALADHADHEGNNIRPGNDLICAKTGLSERTISQKIAKFVEEGILIPIKSQTGRGRKREYRMCLDHLPRDQYFIESEKKKVERASTFIAQKVEARSTFPEKKVEVDATFFGQKVEVDAQKVEVDDISHDKERARLTVMNRHKEHEPSCRSASKTQRAPREPLPPSIEFIRDLLRWCPQKSTWAKIQETLGEDFDRERLRSCVVEWLMRGYNKINISGMLEWYIHGITPRPGGTNGKDHRYPVTDRRETKFEQQDRFQREEEEILRYARYIDECARSGVIPETKNAADLSLNRGIKRIMPAGKT